MRTTASCSVASRRRAVGLASHHDRRARPRPGRARPRGGVRHRRRALVVSRRVFEAGEFETLAEASMTPISSRLHALRDLRARRERADRPAREEIQAAPDSIFPSSVPFSDPVSSHLVKIRAGKLRGFDASRKTSRPTRRGASGLRAVLVRMHVALHGISLATSLKGLSTTGGAEPDIVTALENSLRLLAQFVGGAVVGSNRRPSRSPAVGRDHAGSAVVARSQRTDAAIRSGRPSREHRSHHRERPRGDRAPRVRHSGNSPISRRSGPPRSSDRARRNGPAGVDPARRSSARSTCGARWARGRRLGLRRQPRRDRTTGRGALLPQGPRHDATAARSSAKRSHATLPFRASALMAVPTHPNLARFVTFDSRRGQADPGDGARRGSPSNGYCRPALDMKRCSSCSTTSRPAWRRCTRWASATSTSSVERRLARGGERSSSISASRSPRAAGCATGPYGAPEVWGAVPAGTTPSPMAATSTPSGASRRVAQGEGALRAPERGRADRDAVAHDGMPRLCKSSPSAPSCHPRRDLYGTLAVTCSSPVDRRCPRATPPDRAAAREGRVPGSETT